MVTLLPTGPALYFLVSKCQVLQHSVKDLSILEGNLPLSSIWLVEKTGEDWTQETIDKAFQNQHCQLTYEKYILYYFYSTVLLIFLLYL